MTKQAHGAASAFVRTQPLTMPVAEVIKRGRAAGITISPAGVYSTRGYMRQQGAAAPRADNVVKIDRAPATPRRTGTHDIEVAFLKLAARIGIERAQQLLANAADTWIDRVVAMQ